MAYYSVVLTPRDGVTTDLTGYTRQINDKLVVLNRHVNDLRYTIDDTLRRIVDDAFPRMRHLVKTMSVMKDTAVYATHSDIGWTLASDPAPGGGTDINALLLD